MFTTKAVCSFAQKIHRSQTNFKDKDEQIGFTKVLFCKYLVKQMQVNVKISQEKRSNTSTMSIVLSKTSYENLSELIIFLVIRRLVNDSDR